MPQTLTIDHVNNRCKVHVQAEDPESLSNDRRESCRILRGPHFACGRHRRHYAPEPVHKAALLIYAEQRDGQTIAKTVGQFASLGRFPDITCEKAYPAGRDLIYKRPRGFVEVRARYPNEEQLADLLLDR